MLQRSGILSLQEGSLPTIMLKLLAQVRSDVTDACKREWDELITLHAVLVAESQVGGEPDKSELQHTLQPVLASLKAEEVRWRDGAHAIERRCVDECELLVSWWHANDTASMRREVEAASMVADQLMEVVGKLSPSPLINERAALARAMGIDALDVSTKISQLLAKELDVFGGSISHSLRLEDVLRACFCRGSPHMDALVTTLKRHTRAMASTNGNSNAKPNNNNVGDREFCAHPSGHDIYETAMRPCSDGHCRQIPAAATCLLLSLAMDATPLQRLSGLLPLVSTGTFDKAPLSLRAQKELFVSFYAACAAAAATIHELVSLACEHSAPGFEEAQDSLVNVDAVDASLHAALQERPHTWAMCPPHALEFMMWCATVNDTVRATIAGVQKCGTKCATATGWINRERHHNCTL